MALRVAPLSLENLNLVELLLVCVRDPGGPHVCGLDHNISTNSSSSKASDCCLFLSTCRFSWDFSQG